MNLTLNQNEISFFIGRHSACAPNRSIEDADRPLTGGGRLYAKALGEALKALGFNPDIVLVSKAVRTRQTAEYAFEGLEVVTEPTQSTDNDDLWAEKICDKVVGELVQEVTIYGGNIPIAYVTLDDDHKTAVDIFAKAGAEAILAQLEAGRTPLVVGHAMMACYIAEAMLQQVGLDTEENLKVVQKTALEPCQGFLIQNGVVTLVTP